MTDGRKDINVEIRIRNNLILRKMKEKGIPTVAELIRKTGIIAPTLYAFINMKEAALKEDGSWHKDAVRLADFFQCMPDDLFSERQKRAALKKNRREAEVQYAHIEQLTRVTPDRQLELSSEALQFRATLTRALLRLQPREERVLRMRFGFNLDHEYTLAEIGEQFGVTGSRIMSIEAKALRKLKHPSLARQMRESIGKRGEDYVWYDYDGNPHTSPTYIIDDEVLEVLNFL